MRSKFAFFVLGFAVVSALSNGFGLLFRVSYLLALGIAFSWAWAFSHSRGIAIKTTGSGNRAQVGETFTRRIEIMNTGLLPKVGLEIRELSDLPGYGRRMIIDLPRGGTRRWIPEITCTRRGRFTVGPVQITGTDPFGIFSFERRFGEAHQIVVYPQTYDLPESAIVGPELLGEARLQQRTHYITQNVSNIRDYVFGDSYNRIHWPSTARTNKLMVKEFEQEPGSNVWIVLDLDSSARYGEEPDDTEEYGVTIAASVAKKYLDSTRSVGLVAFGASPELIQAEKGPAQMGRLLEALAVCHATGSMPLSEVILVESSRFTRATTLVIVTSSTDLGAVASMDYVMRKRVRCVVLYVDPTSFGADLPNTPEFLARLVASSIPVHRISKSSSIEQALRETNSDIADRLSGRAAR